MSDNNIIVKPYTWDPRRATRRKGIRIVNEGRFFFIDLADARAVADQIHDLMDTIETTKENPNA